MKEHSGFLFSSCAPTKMATTSPFDSCDLDKCTKNDKDASLTENGATLFGRACFSQDHTCTEEVQIENFSTMAVCVSGMRKWFSGASYIIRETLGTMRNVEDSNVSLRCGPPESLKKVEKDASLGVHLDRTPQLFSAFGRFPCQLPNELYQRRCAVTQERTLPVLEAAHIRPYAMQGTHEVSNGLLLRTDLHKLFDRGYVTISQDQRFEVSSRIKEEFENGRDYYALHGKEVCFPKLPDLRPSPAALEWHRDNSFLG
jgi:hypothetical protein